MEILDKYIEEKCNICEGKCHKGITFVMNSNYAVQCVDFKKKKENKMKTIRFLKDVPDKYTGENYVKGQVKEFEDARADEILNARQENGKAYAEEVLAVKEVSDNTKIEEKPEETQEEVLEEEKENTEESSNTDTEEKEEVKEVEEVQEKSEKSKKKEK